MSGEFFYDCDVIYLRDSFLVADDVKPVFERMYRQAYRGFIPDWEHLSPAESALFDALWSRFNSEAEADHPLFVAMGRKGYIVLNPFVTLNWVMIDFSRITG